MVWRDDRRRRDDGAGSGWVMFRRRCSRKAAAWPNGFASRGGETPFGDEGACAYALRPRGALRRCRSAWRQRRRSTPPTIANKKLSDDGCAGGLVDCSALGVLDVCILLLLEVPPRSTGAVPATAPERKTGTRFVAGPRNFSKIKNLAEQITEPALAELNAPRPASARTQSAQRVSTNSESPRGLALIDHAVSVGRVELLNFRGISRCWHFGSRMQHSAP
jgi:hypothetical protein